MSDILVSVKMLPKPLRCQREALARKNMSMQSMTCLLILSEERRSLWSESPAAANPPQAVW